MGRGDVGRGGVPAAAALQDRVLPAEMQRLKGRRGPRVSCDTGTEAGTERAGGWRGPGAGCGAAGTQLGLVLAEAGTPLPPFGPLCHWPLCPSPGHCARSASAPWCLPQCWNSRTGARHTPCSALEGTLPPVSRNQPGNSPAPCLQVPPHTAGLACQPPPSTRQFHRDHQPLCGEAEALCLGTGNALA